MSNEFEEYKFTAYLLGELDEDERREVEEILATSPSARRQLDEIRETAGLLQEGMQAELLSEPEERLDEGRRARIDRAIASPAAKRAALPWSLLLTSWRPVLAAAASLVVLASLSYWVINEGIGTEKEAVKTVEQTASEQDRPNVVPPAREALDYSDKAGASKQTGVKRDSGALAEVAAPKKEKAAEEHAKLREQPSRPAQRMDEAKGQALNKTRQELEARVPAEAHELSAVAPVPPGVPLPAAAPTERLSMSLQDRAVTSLPPASVTGEVKDVTGGVIPGAVVKLKSPTGDVRQQTATNDNGAFTLSGVPTGQYFVQAEMPGFKTAILGPIQLAGGENRRAEMSLSVGDVAETVTVTAAAPTMTTSSASVASTGVRGRNEARRQIAREPASAPREQDTARKNAAAGPVVVGPVGGGIVDGAGRDQRDKLDRSRLSKDAEFNTESYAQIVENPFVAVSQDPLSTFSIDVDTASYSNLRRFLNSNLRPPADAVRIEEMLNYFQYEYAPPAGRDPIAVHAEVAQAFWKPEHRLVRIGLKAREIPAASRPAVNLVFLVDISGSMAPPQKLPLLREALRLLAERLEEKDSVALVTYAGNSQLVLPPTSGADKATILRALDSLISGGSTNGGGGIKMAYEQALHSFDKKGINRVVLATDGDFNVGMTNQGDLVRYVEEQAKKGVFLTVLGFGIGNYKDSMLETLADKGDGNYAYIDDLNEARRVLVEQMGGTLLPVAKDVKLQVEFNPAEVAAYRLLGYENRVLAHQDFADDTKDAGEIGAGHAVTALYEVVPVGVPVSLPDVEPLKYQTPGRKSASAANREMLTLKIRYKDPAGGASKRMEVPVADDRRVFDQASDDFRFAAAVASFGMMLRDSRHMGATSLEGILEIVRGSKGPDRNGLREEFVRLVEKARESGIGQKR